MFSPSGRSATLSSSTPTEVKEHVRQQVEIMKPGGGFVFQQVHNIMTDVSPDRILAMYEAVREAGAYESSSNPA